jgi:hypothetical protein
MNTPAQDTAVYLASLVGFGAFGGATDWSLYVGREPLEPINVITVYDTGGQPPVGKTGAQVRYTTVQARIRAKEYGEGWQKGDDIVRALVLNTDQATVGGRNVAWSATTDVTFIGRNEADYALFTVNFNLIRSPS